MANIILYTHYIHYIHCQKILCTNGQQMSCNLLKNKLMFLTRPLVHNQRAECHDKSHPRD